MNHNTIIGFRDEIQKTAIFPVKVIEGVQKLKGVRAAVKGSKRQVREAGRLVQKARLAGGKEFNATGKFDEVLQTVKERDSAIAENILSPKTTGPAGEGFLKKHKKKLILGGAIAGGLYLANKMNSAVDEQRQQEASSRNFNVPQRVLYQ